MIDGARFWAFPPGDWAPRGPPTADEVDEALRLSRKWWPWAVGPGRSDDSIASFTDLFDRYLAGEVERRMKLADRPPEQATLPGVRET